MLDRQESSQTDPTSGPSSSHEHCDVVVVGATTPPTASTADASHHSNTTEEEKLFHGYMAAAVTTTPWQLPRCVCKSNAIARPHYSEVDASEYLDSPEVLKAKVDVLVAMLRGSTAVCAYTGAGISTAAGVGDYASKGKGGGKGSLVAREGSTNRLTLQPTPTHRVLAALEKADHLHEWLQQNHDGLGQKAGFPFAKMNEIHGSWFDKHNPVVLMDGHLRRDLHDRMVHWSQCADLVVAMGTSLCGMSADVVAESAAERHIRSGAGSGLVIINLQRTPMDGKAALRIFAKTDDVFSLVAKRMKLKPDTQTYSAYPPPRTRTFTASKLPSERK